MSNAHTTLMPAAILCLLSTPLWLAAQVLLTRERYLDGEEFDEEVGRLRAPACFGEHALDWIPKAERGSVRCADDSSDVDINQRTFLLASGAKIMSPLKAPRQNDSGVDDASRHGDGVLKKSQSSTVMGNDAPPIWKQTVITHPQAPKATLLWISRTKFVKIVGHLRNVLHRNEMQRLIDAVPIFKDLLPQQRQALAGAIDRRVMVSIPAGEVLYKQGDSPTASNDARSTTMFIVRKGSVRIKQVVDNGSIMELHGGPLRAGASFGEKSLLVDVPRDATATTNERAELILLSREFTKSVLGSISVIEQADSARRRFEERRARSDTFHLSELTYVKKIGHGSFGKVFQVVHTPTGEQYALKVMSKESIVQMNMIDHVIAEKNTLSLTNHPFLCRIVTVMRDESPKVRAHPCLAGPKASTPFLSETASHRSYMVTAGQHLSHDQPLRRRRVLFSVAIVRIL